MAYKEDRIRLPNYLIGTDLGALQPSRESLPDVDDELQYLKDQLQELRDHHKELTERVQDNEKSYNSFTQQFQPGRTYVQSLITKLVWEDEIEVPNALQVVFPGGTLETNPPSAAGFDVSNDLQHAYYKLSAYCLNEDVNVLYQGGSFTISTRDVIIGIVRTYKTAPPRLESYITCYNNTGSDQTIHVKVFREIGI